MKPYRSQLLAFKEKPFHDLGIKDKSIRFLWLRSFHPAVCIRVDFTHDSKSNGTICGKELEPWESVNWSIGPKFVESKESLSLKQEAELTELMHRADFWAAESKSEFDGARWIVESWDHGKYQVVNRWCPKDGSVRELGITLLKMAGLYERSKGAVY